MAGVYHISEAEAARDLPGLVDRALAGEEVVVQRGAEDVIVLSPLQKRPLPGRTVAQILESLKDKTGSGGLAMPNEDFAADVASAREGWGAPVNTIRGKTAEEVIRAFARWEEEHGKLTVDDKFAEDVMEGHRIFNQPLDDSTWE